MSAAKVADTIAYVFLCSLLAALCLLAVAVPVGFAWKGDWSNFLGAAGAYAFAGVFIWAWGRVGSA